MGHEAILKALKQEIDRDGDLLRYGKEAFDAPVVAYFGNHLTGKGCVFGYNSLDELEEEYNSEYEGFTENGLRLVRLFVNGQEVEFSTEIKVNIDTSLFIGKGNR